MSSGILYVATCSCWANENKTLTTGEGIYL